MAGLASRPQAYARKQHPYPPSRVRPERDIGTMDGECSAELASEQAPSGFRLHFDEVSNSLWTPSASTTSRRGTHGTQSLRHRTGRQRMADSVSRQAEESGAHVLLAH